MGNQPSLAADNTAESVSSEAGISESPPPEMPEMEEEEEPVESMIPPVTCEADFVALGLGGTNMMCMLQSVAMGKKCVGVEMRGDPFLSIHWNIRVDVYHELGLIDELMLKRYGKQGVPKRQNGKIFKLADRFHSPKTSAGFIVADEVITGYDTQRHISGSIEHVEFIDDRIGADGKPQHNVTVLPPVPTPNRPNPKAIRSNMRDVLDGPSTFQCEANNLLILLRRYLEAVEAMDVAMGKEPRVRLLLRHQVKEKGGITKDENGKVTAVTVEHVQEMDHMNRLVRIPIAKSPNICIQNPEMVVIAQGVHPTDAKRHFGFTKKEVMVDHNNGMGPQAAQADYLAGFIDVLVDGRLRRRISSAIDPETGHEFWTRQIAVGHENDPQVGWVLVQVPDFMSFDPVAAGYVPEGTPMESPEYFGGHERLMYEFYIREASKILGLSEDLLKTVRMAYGPKLFSMVEQVGENPRVAPNVVVAGDSFGNGHFLTSGGAMTGMVGHAMGVHQFWKTLELKQKIKGSDMEKARNAAFETLAQRIKRDTQDWLDSSSLEFCSFAPINFGADRIQQIAAQTHVTVHSRAEASIDASKRLRHELQVQNPSSWRRPNFRNGRVYTAGLKPLVTNTKMVKAKA